MRPESEAASESAFHAALWQDAAPQGLAAPDASENPRRRAVYRNNVHHGLTRALAAAPVALAVADPDRLRLTLHPSLELFASPHAAVRIREAHQPGAAPGTSSGSDLDPATHRVIAPISAGLPLGQAAGEDDPTAALTLLVRHGLIAAIATGNAP